MTISRVAVDQTAKDYWKTLFEDLGYGEALTRDIPRKVQAQLDARLASRLSKNAQVGDPAADVQLSRLRLTGHRRVSTTQVEAEGIYTAHLTSGGEPQSSTFSMLLGPRGLMKVES